MNNRRQRLETHLWQAGRTLAPLSPASANVDDRSFIDNAAFLVAFYQGFPFDERRNWDTLLIGDPVTGAVGDLTFLMASIAATDVKGEYVRARRSIEPNPDSTEVRKLIRGHLLRIDGWRARLDLIQSSPDAPSCARACLDDVDAILAGRNANALASLPVLVGDLSDDPDWIDLMRGTTIGAFWTTATAGSQAPKAVAVVQLVHIHSAFSSATGAIASKSRDYVARTLESVSNHAPHAALLLAVLRLVGRVQTRLNNITERHLDFYFKDVLRLSPVAAQRDVATLAFDVAPQVKSCRLPAGTGVVAGNDVNGQPILYATDRSLELTHARIGAIKAVRLRQDAIATPTERGAPPARMSEVTDISAYPVLASKDGYGAPLATPDDGWPSFGAASGARPCRIGLSIRSPILRLSEGDRRIAIVLRLADPRALAAAVDSYLARLGGTPGTSGIKLSRCFEVAVSTAMGFLTVGHETIFDRQRGLLRFVVSISADHPAIAAPPMAGSAVPGLAVGLPSLRILLNPDAPIYGYSFFKSLDLRYVAIKIAASGLRAVVTSATLGAIDATAPFPPFGSPALNGAALTVSHADLAGKAPTQVVVRMRWSNLPPGPQAFETYYAGYGTIISDTSFRVAIDGFVGRNWVPLTDGDAPLFTESRMGLAPNSVWSLSTRGFFTEAATPIPARPTIRLRLTGPDFGFGQTIYPTASIRAALARPTKPTEKPAAPPNPPFVPISDALTLDVRATTKFLAVADQRTEEPGIFAIDAFGGEHSLSGTTLLPAYPAQGYLFIGIGGVSGATTLVLLFDIRPRVGSALREDIRESGRAMRKILHMSYLSGDNWIAMTDTDIHSDGTQALSRPGLVELRLPAMNRSRNASFDPTLVWIRIEADGDPDSYGRTVAIECNGVEATRVEAAAIGDRPTLPPRSIGRLVASNAAVSALRQGMPTVGGTVAESEASFRNRVSERLRHKNRAILRHDYEAMVLEAFPTIGDAKCYGGDGGAVILVVAPLRIEGVEDAVATVPQYQLQDIMDFVRARASNCLRRLVVRNPAFEPVRIVAWVSVSSIDTHLGLRSLRSNLNRVIAPWIGDPSRPMGIGTPHIDPSDVRAVFADHPDVADATGISLTHLSADHRPSDGADAQSFFSLADSARRETKDRLHVWPKHRHSVLVPAHHSLHVVGALGIGCGAIEDTFLVGDAAATVRSRPRFRRPPRRAGVGTLRLGEDFVIRR